MPEKDAFERKWLAYYQKRTKGKCESPISGDDLMTSISQVTAFDEEGTRHKAWAYIKNETPDIGGKSIYIYDIETTDPSLEIKIDKPLLMPSESTEIEYTMIKPSKEREIEMILSDEMPAYKLKYFFVSHANKPDKAMVEGYIRAFKKKRNEKKQ